MMGRWYARLLRLSAQSLFEFFTGGTDWMMGFFGFELFYGGLLLFLKKERGGALVHCSVVN